ncbi:MAG TPA: prenyltransferase [Bacillota bacterium]|mgnify:CR=1 FL=1|nr:prenyltransferase [Bacillota bacterium]
MLHCVTAHAYNDLTDWRTGTDAKSPGILSGGSWAIKNGLLTERNLRLAGIAGMVLPIVAGIYLSLFRGPLVLVFLLFGIWSSLSYTLPPFMLAYRPFLGEWLAGFPSIVSCTAGSYYVLTGEVSAKAFCTGALHGLLSLGWLMQHHLADISADLCATPPKFTTAAFIYTRWGTSGARLTPWLYFFPAGIAGIVAGLLLDPAFFLTVIPSFLCICLTSKTDTSNIISITRNEIFMISVSACHALILAVLFSLGY